MLTENQYFFHGNIPPSILTLCQLLFTYILTQCHYHFKYLDFMVYYA